MARRLNRKAKRGSTRGTFFLIIFLLLLVAGGYGYITYFEGEQPGITGKDLPAYIGKDTPITFVVSDAKSGIRDITVFIRQGEKEKQILSKQYPAGKETGTAGVAKETITVNITPKKLGLKEGKADISVQVHDYSYRGMLKGNLSVLSHSVTIDTKAPRVGIIHSERYIKPGGAGIVIYSVDDSVKHGVMLNGYYHPGFPLTDESEKKYISYIALHYATESITEAAVVAEDAAGNRTVKPFSPVLTKANQKKDRINIPDSFLARKIPEFAERYPEMQGDTIEQYLYTNRKVRKLNNDQIHDLCMNPNEKQLWSGRFLRMSGSGRAGFADHRTYYYKGKEIDRQVHLGMDIASTRHANIKAAGNGIVVHADYLGIYGNMVMLDHGQGVFSLYSHLSQIDVSVGDSLNQGDVLGKSGTSGMAGGDHLHFSMLVNGIFVTPKEWWDQHWITVTIEEPIADAKF